MRLETKRVDRLGPGDMVAGEWRCGQEPLLMAHALTVLTVDYATTVDGKRMARIIWGGGLGAPAHGTRRTRGWSSSRGGNGLSIGSRASNPPGLGARSV